MKIRDYESHECGRNVVLMTATMQLFKKVNKYQISQKRQPLAGIELGAIP